MVVVVCLIIVSSLAQILSGSRLGLVKLVTRLAKAFFQVSSFKKFSGGVVVACLIIVSTPGPDFVRVKARFGQVGDQVGLG